jgi:hypothetical protein
MYSFQTSREKKRDKENSVYPREAKKERGEKSQKKSGYN